MVAEKKRDWVPAVAVGVGAVGVGTGIWFYLKKPKGVDPGDTLQAKFTFDYYGQGGAYILQISLGHIRIMEPFFDHIEGLTWTSDVNLPMGPQEWEFTVFCPLPEAIEPKTYDGEATIRTPDMAKYDYIIKVVTKGAINVREE